MEVEVKQFTLVPPACDRCQECAADHNAEEPHNPESLYYQIVFHQKHGRYPSWSDAMAHCSQEMQQVWREELAREGVIV